MEMPVRMDSSGLMEIPAGYTSSHIPAFYAFHLKSTALASATKILVQLPNKAGETPDHR